MNHVGLLDQYRSFAGDVVLIGSQERIARINFVLRHLWRSTVTRPTWLNQKVWDVPELDYLPGKVPNFLHVPVAHPPRKRSDKTIISPNMKRIRSANKICANVL